MIDRLLHCPVWELSVFLSQPFHSVFSVTQLIQNFWSRKNILVSVRLDLTPPSGVTLVANNQDGGSENAELEASKL